MMVPREPRSTESVRARRRAVDPPRQSPLRIAAVLVAVACEFPALAQTVTVIATVETQPVPHFGDAADDPGIWVHPSSPASSIVIGTDKQGGLAVYDLAGRQIQYLPDGNLNNVDVRYGFSLGGASVDLVTAGNRSDDTIEVYRVDPATRTLVDVAARSIRTGITMYGSCMYRSPIDGTYYVFVNSTTGQVEQWELFDAGSGRVDARLVRSFSVGSIAEGCVADDELASFFIAQEDVGIWRYGAEPGAGTGRTQVDAVGPRLQADVEGLTIYYAPGGVGYLLASSQGSNAFVTYTREGANAYVGTFRIGDGPSIDGASDTDGIDVANVALGSGFPEGLFVVQDGFNTDAGASVNQNYKLVPWSSIARAFNPPLVVDTTWDPRGGAGLPCSLFDLDGDARVDGIELTRLGRAFGSCSADPASEWWGPIDWDHNGCVDGADLALLAPAFGRECPEGSFATGVTGPIR